MSAKKKPATKGGARKGSGRKPTGRINRKIMLTIHPDLIAKLDRLTGNRSKWVAGKIRNAREPRL